MEGGGGGESVATLKNTPTWAVAAVCSVIVAISLAVERILYFLGEYLKKDKKPLLEALQKVKEELMLLGFISLLLSILQTPIAHICVQENLTHHMLPCKKETEEAQTSHFRSFPGIPGSGRRLFTTGPTKNHCEKGKVPLLSLEELHHLHVFVFVLGIVHVAFCLFTVILGGARIRQWEHWENSIAKGKYNTDKVMKSRVTYVLQDPFIRDQFVGDAKGSRLLCWVHSFFKQLYPSLSKTEYIILRRGFIMTHCQTNPTFNFHKYMLRALEDDFKKVVGMSWYLWIFVVIFLLLNVDGRRIYFWIAFIPLILLLAVGAKLEHIIIQLAYGVTRKHAAVVGDLVVQPSDDHFWFHRPRIILYLIHFILFQNAFEIAFFLWILVIYGFDSCIMGHFYYIITRLTIGVFIQVLCSYSTLPLYAIVTHMGSSFNKAVFEEHVQKSLIQWAENAKNKKRKKGLNYACFLSLPHVVKKEKGSKSTNSQDGLNQAGLVDGSSVEQNAGQKESMMEDGIAEDIDSIAASKCTKPEGS
ncbi:MLO-like protein 1 [Tasmannia lanceolata]|uniref:MLO-like protein 1 n=1 Tax=Tasmannia lanceolata TaxID=3420 RepID=UPI004063B4CC